MVSLSLDPPPFSNRNRPAGAGRPAKRVVLVLALLGCAGGGFWFGRVTAPGANEDGAPAATTAAIPAEPTSAPAQAAAQRPDPGATATPGTFATATAPPGALPAPAPPSAPVSATSLRRLTVALSGALEDSVTRALAPEDRALGDELTQVVNRLLVWDLQVSRDGRKGDLLEVLWSPAVPVAAGMPVSAEPVVEAVRYASQKLASRFAVYRFKPAGSPWPRYYRPDGTELEERLVDGPIREYDQITSLLRDGRRHKGVDFRTPTGTPVFAPFDGTITRRNWNWSANGNALELRDAASGRSAIFIHLDVVPEEMKVGRRVKKGERIASSGNSGRSFAPHLHYQLEAAGGRVLDPFEVHRTEKVVLPAAQRAGFEAARARFDASLDGSPALVQAAGAPASANPVPVAVPQTPR